jgi:hypothetical protein
VQSAEAAAGHLARALHAPEPCVRHTTVLLVADNLASRPDLAPALAPALLR